MSDWISVEERLPEKGETIIAYDHIDRAVMICRSMLSSDDWRALHSLMTDPTPRMSHWMPLPSPPKDQNA